MMGFPTKVVRIKDCRTARASNRRHIALFSISSNECILDLNMRQPEEGEILGVVRG